MPSLIPKPRAELDLTEIFQGESTRATRARVIAALSVAYQKHSERSFADRTRAGVVTEEFSIAMPTEAAYAAEIALCDAIMQHSAGLLPDEEIRTVITRFIEAHTIVHSKGSYEAKVGEYFDWTGKTLPLFYLSAGFAYGLTGNAVQCQLAILLEEAAGRRREWSLRPL